MEQGADTRVKNGMGKMMRLFSNSLPGRVLVGHFSKRINPA
jgi:hypothetical protein